MSGSESLFACASWELAPHFVTPGEPLVDVGFAPDAPSGDLPEGLWEPDLSGELVCSLAAQSERLRYFGDAHEFHAPEFTRALDSVKVHWHSDLDTVKRRKP